MQLDAPCRRTPARLAPPINSLNTGVSTQVGATATLPSDRVWLRIRLNHPRPIAGQARQQEIPSGDPIELRSRT